MAAIHLTILKPSSFSQRSRNGAPCSTLTRRSVHLIGQDRQFMTHVGQAVHIVVAPAVAAVGE